MLLGLAGLGFVGYRQRQTFKGAAQHLTTAANESGRRAPSTADSCAPWSALRLRPQGGPALKVLLPVVGIELRRR
jgi:hypothetical protein